MTVKSEGLAHLSYLVGDQREAFVIDPRRDCQVYAEMAQQAGCRITRIFETHRNEDYVVGSLDLAQLTGATIHHGRELDFRYGKPLAEGNVFDAGNLRLRVLETPGHTIESVSLVIFDRAFGDTPVGVFTGDALFVGDVGRTDLYPGPPQKGAEVLYHSIFTKLLALGDHTILYPAHGAGSICGDNMAEREFSSIGIERLTSPVLQKSRDQFISHKVNEHHYQPPYFRRMELYNQHGAPSLAHLPRPVPMSPNDVAEAQRLGALVLDLRSPEAVAGAFVPGSLAIPLELVPAYAGYLLEFERDLILLPETPDQVPVVVACLIRMGYERIPGYLKEGMHAWETSGREFDRIGTVHARVLSERLKRREDFTLLDVRKISEFRRGRLPGARHLFLGDLPAHADEFAPEKPVVTFCGSGQRAIIAASILKQRGFRLVEDCLGSMAACKASGCKIEQD